MSRTVTGLSPPRGVDPQRRTASAVDLAGDLIAAVVDTIYIPFIRFQGALGTSPMYLPNLLIYSITLSHRNYHSYRSDPIRSDPITLI